jgi:hypothetical protein
MTRNVKNVGHYFLGAPPLGQGRIADLLVYFEKKTAPELKQWK